MKLLKRFISISLLTFTFSTIFISSFSFAQTDEQIEYYDATYVGNVIECRYQDGSWINLINSGSLLDCGSARIDAYVNYLKSTQSCSVTASNRLVDSHSATTGVTYVSADIISTGLSSCESNERKKFRILYKEIDDGYYQCNLNDSLVSIDNVMKCERRITSNPPPLDCPTAGVDAITSFTTKPNEKVCYQLSDSLWCEYYSNENNFYLLPIELATMEPIQCVDVPDDGTDLTAVLASMDIMSGKLSKIDTSINQSKSEIVNSINSLDIADNQSIESLSQDVKDLNQSNKLSNDQIIESLSQISNNTSDLKSINVDNSQVVDGLSNVNSNIDSLNTKVTSITDNTNSIKNSSNLTNNLLSDLPNVIAGSLINNDGLLSEINQGIKDLNSSYNNNNPDDPVEDKDLECTGELCDSTYESDMKDISSEFESYLSDNIEPPSELTSYLQSYSEYIKNNFSGFKGQCLPFVLDVSIAGIVKQIKVDQHCGPYDTYFKPLVVWILYTLTFISCFNISNQTLRTFSNS